jgi:hypothetical protein
MIVALNEDTYRLCGDERRVEYLLDWITGYARKDNVMNVLLSGGILQTSGNVVMINIDDSTMTRIKRKFNLRDDSLISSCVNILLIVAIVMGGGE